MSYLGLIPSEYSSGDATSPGRHHQDGQHPCPPGADRRGLGLPLSGQGQPPSASCASKQLPKPIQDISWKAQVRLCKRYRQLIGRGKNANQVVVAIARELSAFMWAIAQEVPADSLDRDR